MFDSILEAAERLNGVALKTPVLNFPILDERSGKSVFLKCENFQHIGAFKFRGAYNTISQLDNEKRKNGIVAFSSGNHAQAVARVAQIFNVPCTIVMPYNAPKIKLEATKSYGAKVVTIDPLTENREEVAQAIIAKSGATLVPPFNHEHILSGQGTAALELMDTVTDLDLVVAPCGGGGLLSGTSIAVKGRNSDCKVIGIEPELGDDATRSFKTKTLQRVKNPPTIADGTRTESLGPITFDIILKYVDDMITVSETEIMEAVIFCYDKLKLVIEPSGVLGIAALLSGKLAGFDRIGVIVSGGNMDIETLSDIKNHLKK
ncbi:MAG: pyridoxal-phosphate dependent enzyme [Calditrichaeota bacterium]|nr:pyridoxal-phosphate dependent enzyme [Calditrichota bacterium]